MSLTSDLYYLCFLVLVGLALFIYLKDPRAWLNRYFALFSVSILGWLATLLYLYNQQANTPQLTVLGRANFLCAACIVLSGYLFLAEVARRRPRHVALLVLETAILSLLTIGTGLIDRSERIVGSQHVTSFGVLYPVYIAHIAAYFVAALFLVFTASTKASAKVRGQLAVIGLGMFATMVIAITTNIVLPYVFHSFALQEVGALSTIALLAAIAYAITRTQLFDVRVVIRRTVVYTVLLGLMFSFYSTVVFLLGNLVQGGPVRPDLSTTLVNMVAFCLIGFGFDPIRKKLSDATDRFLFQREYNQQEVLADLSRKLNDVITLDEALEILMQAMAGVFHLGKAVAYVLQPGEHGVPAVKRIKQIGYSGTTPLLRSEDTRAIQFFAAHPGLMTRESLEAVLADEEAAIKNPRGHRGLGLLSSFIREHAEKQAVDQAMADMRAEVAIPLHLGEQPLGLILLSAKGSGEAYSEEDLLLLDSIGSHAISSIQKAKLYEGDQMKSEFVSIASHELLTPISAMIGYLSMIQDEHLGKVDKQASDYLDKVYVSAKRLSALVKDLLSVSRIEAGRIKIAPQSLDLTKVIGDAVDQLRFTAQAKHLKLTFEKPAEALPAVWADPDRTMEVLVNLIGNAIKYTPRGSVTVRASADKTAIRVEVADTGLGMSRRAQSHLFEKFYRVATSETEGIAGTGLGLYITKSIVEKMGGSIGVHSVEGKGSTFSFTLPVFHAERSSLEKRASAA